MRRTRGTSWVVVVSLVALVGLALVSHAPSARAEDAYLAEMVSNDGIIPPLVSDPYVILEPGGAYAIPSTGSLGSADQVGERNDSKVTDTTRYPYRAVVDIERSEGPCTGFLISKDTVATAGHCVFDYYNNQGWADNVRVYPGRNGSQTPYGSCGVRRMWTTRGWKNYGNRDYDWGAMKLDCTKGSTVGWFGFRWTSYSLQYATSRISGYPWDKNDTQWTSLDDVSYSWEQQLLYENDTYGGQSGSPVYNNYNANCSPCAIAIHASGRHGDIPYNCCNRGTRITRAVFENLVRIRN